MTESEKKELFYKIERAKSGDAKAMSDVISQNQGLVYSVANRIYSMHKVRVGSVLDLDDFVSEGNIALMRAIQLFDTKLGVEFSTYANLWITQKCKAVLKDFYSPIRVPRGTFEKTIKKLIDGETDFTQYQNCARAALRVLSLDETLPGDREETYLSVLEDADGIGPEEELVQKETHNLLQNAIDKYLSEREAYVVKMRNNWDSLMKKAASLETIGCSLSLTRERIRQIEKKSYERLRKKLKDQLF